MIVVDSSVWIDQFRGRASPPQAVLDDMLRVGGEIAITDVIYMELLRGVASQAQAEGLRGLLQQTAILRMESLEDFELAADLVRRVRRHGHTVRQSSDCMIAAVCIRESYPLLQADIDFAHIAAVSELRLVA